MIVLVMGVSGSGKNAVGEPLAQRLGWKFIDGDDYHPPENVQKIEELLGVAVFEIQGRKAQLTPTGTMLYRRALSLVEEAGLLERTAKTLSAYILRAGFARPHRLQPRAARRGAACLVPTGGEQGTARDRSGSPA